MDRMLIVSNRLPVKLDINDDEIEVTPSVGGLATGMKSVYQQGGGKWLGWPGLTEEEVSEGKKKKISKKLEKESCIPVFLKEDDIDKFYFGFSNKTIWPLFHYFPQYTEYEQEYWTAYKRVNEIFAEAILEHIHDFDSLWIHDYHLLLLPKLIKDKHPNLSIGFFLHIPFPSFELFRVLPWRMELLEGMLGADLLGFHTYDYERHFLSSVRRLKGYDIFINQIKLPDRIVKVDAFPMGIDYNKFHDAAVKLQNSMVKDKSKIGQEIDKYYLADPDRKLILSIDRLDYSKGISNRLHAYELFLERYPEFREKVTLVLLAVPSRIDVEQYQALKSEVDELVGRINGEYSTINWTPIWYFYRSLPFQSLVELYSSCEVALITPMRDGMNLVAKEFIATKTNGKGVLILSEMAGAAKELSEAIIINPNNFDEIAEAIRVALDIPYNEQNVTNKLLQERLKRYNVEKWADDFLKALENSKKVKSSFMAKKMNPKIQKGIVERFRKSKKRILFLDYDGTLVDFKSNPKHATPDDQLYNLLNTIAQDDRNEIVLISGRDKDIFQKWFKDKRFTLIVEHGAWIKYTDSDWQSIEPLDNSWKEIIEPVFEFYVDRTPGSFYENKTFSLVWHFRKVDPDLGQLRAIELKDELNALIGSHNLELLEGNKVVEIKSSGINKGRAAMKVVSKIPNDFILALGDDWTDEYLFQELSDEAVTIKVGFSNTKAKYNIPDFSSARELLMKLAEEG